MPSGSYRQADVQCPFYKYDDGRRHITCEGIVDESSLSLNYHRRRDYEMQIVGYCCQHYIMCEVYRMLMDKYPDD